MTPLTIEEEIHGKMAMAAVLLLATLPLASADFADFGDGAKTTGQAAFQAHAGKNAGVLSLREQFSSFWSRNSPYDFIYQGSAFLFLIFYIVLSFIGKSKNEKVAKKKFGLLYRQLHDNFALIGEKRGAAALMKDSDETFLSHLSGRANVDNALVTISTFPRQDVLFGYPFRSIYGMYFDQKSMQDRIEIEFTLPAKFEGFVFGLVNKSVMRFQRIDKWDLQFTKTNDAPFSNSFVIMSEVAEVTDKIMSPELTLIASDMQDSLEYIVVSDQPTFQPKGPMNKILRTLRLSVLLDKKSANENNLNSLFAVVLSIIDALPKSSSNLSPNSIKKLQGARDDAYKAIAKFIAEEEAEEAPKRLTRKEIRDKESRERLAKLPAKDQKKAMEKERERQMRRGQKSMTKKA